MLTFYEFFAGGGMARAGLGKTWSCVFANDFDQKKATSYRANWGGTDLAVCDVGTLKPKDLPGFVDLAWASFPCQDLSLAGAGAGLGGERSGTFWAFWELMRRLGKENRAPRLIVLENVCGAMTSHDGKDFAAIGSALSAGNYQFGALVVDAMGFVPQSRPRLFIVGVLAGSVIPPEITAQTPVPPWHTDTLVYAWSKLSNRATTKWVWWTLPVPARRSTSFADLIEEYPHGVHWHTAAETAKLLRMMSPLNRAKVKAAKQARQRIVGAVYKRTRKGADGKKVQRAEVRFDEVAGCLRTPAGGSSRQSIVVIEGERVRSRLLSPREAARLMGLPDSYKLSMNYNDAYHLAGDGVVVPVVRYLAKHLLEPLLFAQAELVRRAA